jgi:hypothetical protein
MGKTLENYRIPLPKKREKIHGDKKSLYDRRKGKKINLKEEMSNGE